MSWSPNGSKALSLLKFELGGHSLLATQIITHIQSTLQVEIPLHQLFATPTIVSLVAALPHSSTALQVIPRRDASPPSLVLIVEVLL